MRTATNDRGWAASKFEESKFLGGSSYGEELQIEGELRYFRPR